MKNPKEYSAEFKKMAVDLINTGKPIAEIAKELCINSGLLYRWLSKSRRASGSTQEAEVVENQNKELQKLQKEVARLQLENDILKKAAMIFSNNQQVTLAK